jgi:hypothetical protein
VASAGGNNLPTGRRKAEIQPKLKRKKRRCWAAKSGFSAEIKKKKISLHTTKPGRDFQATHVQTGRPIQNDRSFHSVPHRWAA